VETKTEEHQELAEKVAGYLGLSKAFTSFKGTALLKVGLLSKHFYSWQTTGLMIEHLQEKGWWISMELGCVYFYLPSNDPSGIDTHQTKVYCSENYGYHEAIARAFVEAMEIIEGRNE
jgi:hypothetical protein